MTPSIKLIGTVSSILLLGGGFYIFDWSERYARRASAQSNLSERQEHWQKLQAAIAEFPHLQQEKRRKQGELEKVMASAGPPEQSDDLVANYLVEVERHAAGGLSIRSITPAPGSDRTRVFALSMQGGYAQVVDFLYELSARRLNRVVTINSLHLDRGQGGKLTVDLPVTAYLR